MKYYLFTALLLFTNTTKSQTTRTAILKVDSSLNKETFSIPFSEIKVIDARFDRTKIGCSYNSIMLNYLSFEKFNTIFPDSFHTYLPAFLSSFIKTDASNKDQLIVLVKQFRIADHILKGIESNPLEVEMILKISASFYALHDNKCYKLFSVDNLLMQHIEKLHERKRKFEEGTRSTALQIMLQKLLHTQNWQPNLSQPYFSLKDMENGISKRFDLPVYSSALKKGIYKNFSDFKNNTPSNEDFNIIYKKDKIDHIEYSNGKLFVPGEIWGICDGQKNYLIVRDEFTELIPNDKSFRVLSYATRSEQVGSARSSDMLLSGMVAQLKDQNKIQQYFDLDMETGKLYLQEVFGKSSLTFGEISND